MKYPTIIIALLFCAINGLLGQQVNGVVYYQNSGSQPAEGIEINALGCESTYSLTNGLFSLNCPNKKAGQKVEIFIGKDDINGSSIELVNNHQLEWLTIPEDPTNELIKIIICPLGQKNEAAKRYYGILETEITSNFEKERERLNAEINRLSSIADKSEKDKKQLNDLIKEKDALIIKYEDALEKIEEQAKYIASISKDHANEIVKTAIKQIEEQKDIKAALNILSVAKLEEAYQSALEKKIKAVNEIEKVVEGFELRIKLLEASFNYTEIVICYEKLINILGRNKSGKTFHLSSVLNNIALTYLKLADFKKALQSQIRVIEIREEILDENHPSLATAYNNIALTFNELKQYNVALTYNQKAIDIREKILDSKHLQLAVSYDNIALTYYHLGKYEKALEFHLMALEILNVKSSEALPDIAICYCNIALTLKSLGQYQKALEFQLKSIEIREQTLNNKNPDLATGYNNIALTYLELGQYHQALEFQLKSIEILEVLFESTHPVLATNYSNIALTYLKLGQYHQALEFQLKSIGILEVLFESTHPVLATNYSNISIIYLELGQFQKALDFQLKAIEICEAVLKPNHPSLAISYNNFLHILNEKAKNEFKNKAYKNALNDFAQIIAIQEDTETYNYIGLCHYYLSNFQKAIEAYEKAAQLSPEIKNTNYYNNIGTAYAKNKQFKLAKNAFTEYQKLFPENGRSYRNWAMYYALMGNKQQAFSNLTKAVKLGYNDIKWLKNDSSMDSLRSEKEFQQIIELVKQSLK